MEGTSSWWPGSPRSGAPAPAREAPGAQTYDEIMARAAASRGEASSPRPVITLHRVGSGRRGGSKDPREYDRLESRLKALQKKISLVRSHLREADESAAAERAAELAEAEALAANTRANRLYELKEATVVGAADLPPHTAASVYDVEQLPVARAVVLPYLPEAARPMPVRIRVPYIHAAA
ncbi:hypothetical protein JL722_4100 [Aureococcus anophagefferens]|nr:hypothetical protein JL722_4100 [Aureococcus anophagefferens]